LVEIIKQELENQKPATLRNPWWDFSTVQAMAEYPPWSAASLARPMVNKGTSWSTPYLFQRSMSKALPIHAKA
jgi:hypothetical protein